MKVSEAIKRIKNMAFMCENYEKCQYGHQCTTKCLKATEMAIKALEEIQQYKAIGTVEEFKALKENKRKCEDCAGCTNWLCDCANERAKAIDDVMEKAKEIQEKQIKNLEQSSKRSGKRWAIYMNTYLGHIQVACKRLIAEHLKGGATDEC